MKLTRQQIATIVTGILATLAIILVLIKPGAQPEADKINELSRQIESFGGKVPETAKAPERNISEACWVDVTGSDRPYRCDAWSWKTFIGRPTTLLLKLGEADSDGEVRYLLMKDGYDGAVSKVGQLPKTLTYIQSFSEFDGSPINDSPERLGREGNAEFRIETYLSNVPVSVFDYRLPVMIKYIQPTY